jgi:hypothetical protein
MRLPSHHTVVAYAALFVALGGTSYAAIKLPANSVGSRELRNRSVQLRDLAPPARPPTRARLAESVTQILTDPNGGLNITVHGEKGDKGDAGPQGPAGPQGAPGLQNVTTREATGNDVGPNQEAGAVAQCAPGETVLGGGGRFEATGTSSAQMTQSLPDSASSWRVTYQNGSVNSGHVHAWAVCAVVSG